MPQTTFSGEPRASYSGAGNGGVGLQNVPRGTQSAPAPQNNIGYGPMPNIPLRQPHEVGQPSFRQSPSPQHLGGRAQGHEAGGENRVATTNTLNTLSAQTRNNLDVHGAPRGTTITNLGSASQAQGSSVQGATSHSSHAHPRGFDSLHSLESSARTKAEAEELTAWTLQHSGGFDDHTGTAERFAGPAASLEEDERKATETALSLAEELSDVTIDEGDYETPAYLRRKEDPTKTI
jgi:hypothetical protein